MKETNFVHDGMTNPHRTFGIINAVGRDSGFIQGSGTVMQEQQAVPEILQLPFIHEILAVDADEWCRVPKVAPSW